MAAQSPGYDPLHGVCVHPWHGLALGDVANGVCPSVIEIPLGSKNKYEIDKHTGMLKLDRVLYSAVHYPANYGFVPQTYCEDGDALDVLVLTQEPVTPLCVVEMRAIGVLTMHDEKGRDDKLIGVALGDPEYSGLTDISQLTAHRLKELQRFFMDYKVLEKKRVKVDAMLGRSAAHDVLRGSAELYRQCFIERTP